MRHVILLAVLTTATPAFADDCPPEQDNAVFQLDSLRLLWQQLHTLLRAGSVSNGLDVATGDIGHRAKTPYSANPTRDAQCGPDRALVGSDLMDHLFE